MSEASYCGSSTQRDRAVPDAEWDPTDYTPYVWTLVEQWYDEFHMLKNVNRHQTIALIEEVVTNMIDYVQSYTEQYDPDAPAGHRTKFNVLASRILTPCGDAYDLAATMAAPILNIASLVCLKRNPQLHRNPIYTSLTAQFRTWMQASYSSTHKPQCVGMYGQRALCGKII